MMASHYFSALHAVMPVADGDLDDTMNRLVNTLAHLRAREQVVHLIGNGGSAAIVAHAQNDFVKGCRIKTLVHQDVPLLTAQSNDLSYTESYQQLGLWLQGEDVLIAVSSSGASQNILHAASAAKLCGAWLVTLTGFALDNPLRRMGDLNFYVPSSDYGQVELTHAALLHCLTDRLAHAR